MYLKMFRYILFFLPAFVAAVNLGLIRTKPATIDSFYKNLEKHNVDKVYFSEDLKNVYFQEKDDEDGLEIPAYRTIVSNPLMTDRIIKRSGGYTLFNEYPDIVESGLYTKDLLKKKLIVALGGKAAEQVFYGREQVSLGAVQDLKQANSIARRMVGNYGMGNDLEVFYNENIESGQTPFLGRSLASSSGYADYTMEKMDKEALMLVDDAYVEALNLLSSRREQVSSLINKLLESTNLSGKEVEEFIK